MNKNTYCVIDIGTNSVRLMFAHLEQGRVVRERKYLNTVRTGQGVDASGRLCEAAILRTVNAISEFANMAREQAPDAPLYCFATSAVRDAANREDFVRRVWEAAQVTVQVLNGDQEARCGFMGAVGTGLGGILDIGGGSTEVVYGSEGKVSWGHSFQIGCVRALERFAGDEQAAYESAKADFGDLRHTAGRPFYAIGGTATALAAMDLALPEYDAAKITGHRLHKSRLWEMWKGLEGLSVEQRAQIAGLESRRADVIGYGLAIMLAFLEVSGMEELIVSDADNLEGALALWLEEK